MNYTELIAALSLEMRLDLAGAGRTGWTGRDGAGEQRYVIRFDDAVDVTIEAQAEAEAAAAGPAASAAGDVVHLHAALAPIGGSDPDARVGVGAGVERERLFAALMQIHLFGVATDDAYFGFDAGQDRVTLSKSQPLRGLDAAQAVRSVASFVDQCLRWNAALPLLAASG
ncbi:MAG: CesT family type III secretion system chaperone [Janthinobacterium lividum]